MTRSEATKTLKRLREYRERIFNDLGARCQKHQEKRIKNEIPALIAFMNKAQARIRLANARIDKIEAFFPRVN
jgi:hypothetical protein